LVGDGATVQFNHPDKDTGGLGRWGIIDNSAAFDGSLRKGDAREAERTAESRQPEQICVHSA
jgi:hypothetical protein